MLLSFFLTVRISHPLDHGAAVKCRPPRYRNMGRPRKLEHALLRQDGQLALDNIAQPSPGRLFRLRSAQPLLDGCWMAAEAAENSLVTCCICTYAPK